MCLTYTYICSNTTSQAEEGFRGFAAKNLHLDAETLDPVTFQWLSYLVWSSPN